MSDNKLLAENTIRRFMKLANVEGLTENFMEDLEERGAAMAPAKRGKKKMEEEVEETNEEINEEEEVDLEENFGDLQEEEDEEDVEMDAELGDEPEAPAAEPDGAADMSLTEEEAQLLIDLGERLSAAMGGAEEAPADDMAAMDDEDDMDAMGDMDPEGEEDMVQEDQEELVNEIFKRVTKRLVAEKLKNRK